ncbi:MAG TPA: hypothetical protein VFP27_06180 [Mycobacterium sp.]|nr:hypothetical protein [Mycobacterium sp.]
MANVTLTNLPPGLWLVDVRPNGRVVWVDLPDTPADRALPLDTACEVLLKPALAMIRHEREG